MVVWDKNPPPVDNRVKDKAINIDMEKEDLKKLTKGQLIKLLMNQGKKPNTPPRTEKWESVTEDIILPPPEQFQDGYRPIPKPRTDRTPKHGFKFDDDIFQTGNQSLENSK